MELNWTDPICNAIDLTKYTACIVVCTCTVIMILKDGQGLRKFVGTPLAVFMGPLSVSSSCTNCSTTSPSHLSMVPPPYGLGSHLMKLQSVSYLLAYTLWSVMPEGERCIATVECKT